MRISNNFDSEWPVESAKNRCCASGKLRRKAEDHASRQPESVFHRIHNQAATSQVLQRAEIVWNARDFDTVSINSLPTRPLFSRVSDARYNPHAIKNLKIPAPVGMLI